MWVIYPTYKFIKNKKIEIDRKVFFFLAFATEKWKLIVRKNELTGERERERGAHKRGENKEKKRCQSWKLKLWVLKIHHAEVEY